MAVFYGDTAVAGLYGGGSPDGLSAQLSAHDADVKGQLSAHNDAISADVSNVAQAIADLKRLVEQQRSASPMPVFDYAQEVAFELTGTYTTVSAAELPFDCRVFVTNRHNIAYSSTWSSVYVDGHQVANDMIQAFPQYGAAPDCFLSGASTKYMRWFEAYNTNIYWESSGPFVMTQFFDVGFGQSAKVVIPRAWSDGFLSATVRFVPYRYGRKSEMTGFGPFALSSLTGGGCFRVLSCQYTTDENDFGESNFKAVDDWATEVIKFGDKPSYVHARVYVKALESGTFCFKWNHNKTFYGGGTNGYEGTGTVSGTGWTYSVSDIASTSIPSVQFYESPVLIKKNQIIQLHYTGYDSDNTRRPYFPQDICANDVFNSVSFSSMQIARS